LWISLQKNTRSGETARLRLSVHLLKERLTSAFTDKRRNRKQKRADRTQDGAHNSDDAVGILGAAYHRAGHAIDVFHNVSSLDFWLSSVSLFPQRHYGQTPEAE
jgi:hypothetical protein